MPYCDTAPDVLTAADAQKLRILADWFDRLDASGYWGNEIQNSEVQSGTVCLK